MSAILRRLTRAFIDRYPTSIVLTTVVSEETPSGGVRLVEGRRRPAQVVTLVEPSDSNFGRPARTEQGETDRYDMLMVGESDLQVAEGELFDYMGDRCRVERVMPDNGYEVRATVTRGV